MKQTAWGRYPIIDATKIFFSNVKKIIPELTDKSDVIPYGNGRSYGDSALSDNVVMMRGHEKFLSFDAHTGILHVQSGVLLSEILEVFLPRGWFLSVTPGTKLITVGGAIASDVHGKNHHVNGCFSECVDEFTLINNTNDKPIVCTKESNPELFHATCGGMGLTGIITDAKIKLQKVRSKNIDQVTIKSNNLAETFEAFEKYKDYSYSVAWIDCLASGEKLGRSLLSVGEHSEEGKCDYKPKKTISIPIEFPSFVLNKWSVKAFNFLYFNKVTKKVVKKVVGIDSFFYPLDAIGGWNKIYGKSGFTQYQFVLPKERSFEGLTKILNTISSSGKGSFLAVLKLFGQENENYLSFPKEGYTLALDFKIEEGLFKLLNELDRLVNEYGGRVYLTKDVRISKENFEKGYPNIEKFRAFRQKFGLNKTFNSIQSKRVGL